MFYYLLFINILTFFLSLYQKKITNRNKQVKERIILFPALCGGGIGFTLGTRIFQYKQEDPFYRFGISCIFVMEAYIYCFLKYKCF